MSVATISHDLSFTEDKPIPGPSRVDLPVQPGHGQWPRMLVLKEETKDSLKLWLEDELARCMAERSSLIEDWERWQEDYWATPREKVKNFPFERAANIVIPLTAISVEAVYARLLNTIFSVKPFWSIRPRSLPWADAAPFVEKWLQTEVENINSLDMYGVASHSLMEFTKLGTGVLKTGYEREVRKSLISRAGRDEEHWTEVRNGAAVHFVPLANFLIRLSDTDTQTCAWVGEHHEFTWTQLKRMALSGRISASELENLKAHWRTTRSGEMGSPGGYQDKVDALANAEPIWNGKFGIEEIWCAFDVDGDNIDEEIVIDFHRPSRTILSARYNWYQDLHRPYRVGQFIPVEGRLFGIGVGKQGEQFQQEITTIHRQRLDNATLANMRMIMVKRGLGYSADEPIFPGKMWFVNDFRDIQPLQLSEVYPSSFANEQSAQFWSDKRTGVNDVMLGVPQQGTPGTATDMLTRLAEGNKKFDMVLKNVRRWYGLVGQDVLANFQQFGNQDRHWLTEGDKGHLVEMVLRMPQQMVSQGAIVELTVTDSITNRQVEQQQWMGLFQIVTQYYQQVIQLSEILQNPEVTARLAERALSASDFAAKRLFESFAIVDYEPLLLLSEEREGANGSVGQGAVGGPAQGSPEGNGASRMAGIPEIAGLLGGAATSSNGGSSLG